MAVKKQAKSKTKDKKPSSKKKKTAEKLPFCTSAPSAEHQRASDEDGPCDDAREGKNE